MTKSRVGLIGVGLLGSALAERMHQGGFVVSGYDINWSYFEQLLRERPEVSDAVVKTVTVEQIVADHDTIVMCLPDSAAVERVIGRLEQELRSGTLIIDATTGDPDSAEQIAARLANLQVGYVDATIAGSSQQARQGEAVVVIGGRDRDVERASAVLESWSSRRFHVGLPGSGQRMKLVINLVLGLNRAVLAEGLNLAERAGMDPAAALEVLKETPAYSAAMDTKGVKMLKRDYAVQAKLSQHLKDVTLIRALADRSGAATPLSDVHEDLLRSAAAGGFAEADNSAIIEAYLRREIDR
jgi:2-hydroxy-3-oxopropionate reductase